MKYSELIQFQPIESVIELRQANKTAKAKELGSTEMSLRDILTGFLLRVAHERSTLPPERRRSQL